MSDETLEPLEPELKALFEAEARFPEAPAELRAAVLSRLSSPGGPAVPAPRPRAGLKLVQAVALVVGGGLGGAVLHAELAAPPAPQIIEVPGPAPAPVPIVIPLPVPPPAPLEAAPRVPFRSPPKGAPEAAQATSELGRERAMIDAARTAIAQGHAGEALEVLGRHASEFPRGALSEEREGLSVLALARAGRTELAREAAARFRARYPESVLLPAIDALVSPGP